MWNRSRLGIAQDTYRNYIDRLKVTLILCILAFWWFEWIYKNIIQLDIMRAWITFSKQTNQSISKEQDLVSRRCRIQEPFQFWKEWGIYSTNTRKPLNRLIYQPSNVTSKRNHVKITQSLLSFYVLFSNELRMIHSSFYSDISGSILSILPKSVWRNISSMLPNLKSPFRLHSTLLLPQKTLMKDQLFEYVLGYQEFVI